MLALTSSFLLVSGCHNDVVKVVELAGKHDVVIIPFGGKFDVTMGTLSSSLETFLNLSSQVRAQTQCMYYMHILLTGLNFLII